MVCILAISTVSVISMFSNISHFNHQPYQSHLFDVHDEMASALDRTRALQVLRRSALHVLQPFLQNLEVVRAGI
jgi:hypothetical protein